MLKKLVKTLFVAFLTLGMVFALGACGNESKNDTYTVIFETGEGYTFRNEADNADLPDTFSNIKFGDTIKFMVVVASGYIGTPVIAATDGSIVAGPNEGVYMLTVAGNTTVSVTGLNFISGTYTVIFVIDYGYNFRNEANTADLPAAFSNLESGSTVRFRVLVTAGYAGTPIVTVAVGGTVTGPIDGVYTLTVTDNATVSVIGLESISDTYTVTFESGANYTFRNEAGYADLPGTFSNLEIGYTIKFIVAAIGGYIGTPVVTATEGGVVTGPVDGVYTLTVVGNTTVHVSGIDDFYVFDIWSENGVFDFTGSIENGFAITVEAGDTVHVNTKMNDEQLNMFHVWFVLTEVNLGDPTVTAEYLGAYNIICNPFYSKWLILPASLTGSVTIEFWDIFGLLGISGGYMGTLSITVIPAIN